MIRNPIGRDKAIGLRIVNGKRWRKYVRVNDPCVWCQRLPDESKKDKLQRGRSRLTLDHLWPKNTTQRQNGQHDYVAACYRCNHKRGSTPILQYLASRGFPSKLS